MNNKSDTLGLLISWVVIAFSVLYLLVQVLRVAF